VSEGAAGYLRALRGDEAAGCMVREAAGSAGGCWRVRRRLQAGKDG
jgi:hypothetical protein